MVKRKEKHAKTGTTLLHASDSIEISVSSPPLEQSQDLKRRNSLNNSFAKMRLFRLKRSQSLYHSKDAKKNESDEYPAHQNVVITPKARRSSLKNNTLGHEGAAMPQVVPVGSSYSDDTVIPCHTAPCQTTPCHTSDSSSRSEHSIVAIEEPPAWETYFQMTDFAKINWMETVTLHSTESLSLGFISVMAAAVVIHPILFVTGAATAVWAVGVVHAVEKGYEFFSDGQFKNMFWADSEVEEFQLEDGDEKEDLGTEIIPMPIVSSPINSKNSNRGNPLSPLPLLSSPLLSPVVKTSKKHWNSLDAVIVSNFPQLETDVVSAEFPGLNALNSFIYFFRTMPRIRTKTFNKQWGM